MEESSKRRRLNSNNTHDFDSNSMTHPPDIVQYLFEIGRICESTYGLLYNLQTQINQMDEKIKKIEEKSESTQQLVSKMHHSFLREVQQKDIEIATLKELNQNIIADYEKRIQESESESESKSKSCKELYSSFYA
jgi:hypothetical protein